MSPAYSARTVVRPRAGYTHQYCHWSICPNSIRIHKILHGKLVAFEVADVDNPNPVRTVLFGQGHLIPNFCDRAAIKPLITARPAVVIEVIIDSRAAAVLEFPGGRQTADIAPIIFRPKQGHIVGDAQTRCKNP